MRIVNIVEITNGVPSINQSFAVYEEQLSQEVVEKAEELFKELMEINNQDELQEEEINKALKDGFWETEFQQYYSVHIIWSDV